MNGLIGFLAVIGALALIFFTIEQVCRAIGWARTKKYDRKVIDEFCKQHNYCLYGCGGGRSHDDKQYYGGYGCSSDHK